MRVPKLIRILLLGFVFLSLGFIRDFLFLNVNEQTRIAYYHSSDSQLAPSLHFLTAYSYSKLYYLKWALTFVFSVIYMGLSVGIVKVLFAGKKYLRWTVFAYTFLIILAGIFWYGGYLAGHSENGYLISRFLMGMAQGPVVLMVLVPAFKLMDVHSIDQKT